MPISMRRAALAVALAAAAPALAATGAAAQDQQAPRLEKKATHGAWDVVCAPNGACAMTQTGKSPDGQDMLKVTLRKVPEVTADSGQTVDTVFVAVSPLGVMLRAGMALQVDGGQVERLPYEACDRGGCIVQTLVLPKFVDNFKKGVTATFTLTIPGNKQVSTDISLSGFTAAYNSLKAPQQ
ncbi:invasion associated locus B family protein [Rhodovulum sp. DZ06]|uniref:invasion associated locus B family protein n=1 Tax=Rhodovulum sp. DZ06 TaxID=3425126 RepID=UPI003D356C3B